MNRLIIMVLLIPLLLVPLVNAVPNLPIKIIPSIGGDSFALVGNATLYANGTDYWIKGAIKNISHVSMSPVLLMISFEDKTSLHSAGLVVGATYTNMDPGEVKHFDADTGYTIQKGNQQFPYLNASIAVQ